MKQLFPLLFVFLACDLTTHSQPINRVKLDSLFNTLAANNMAMASIAISSNGKIVYQKSIGSVFTEGDNKKSADQNTEYRIGSITKMFTAVMVFQLMEEKKISVNDTLSKYFPSLPNAGRITVGMMLNHRSGLPNFTNGTNYDDWKEQPKTHEQLLALIENRKPDFEPNEKADYNNSNYLLLGYIVEKICNKPYKDVLNERIISKLGLSKTYYGSGIHIKDECASYTWSNDKWVKAKDANLDNFCGAGAIVSTPSDMTKFIEAIFSYKLISKTILDKMKTMADDYGMGMFPYSFQLKKGFGHNGKTEGFASSLSYYPNDKLTIAYCTNGEVYPKDDILKGVQAICFNAPYIIPSFVPLVLKEEVLNQYTGNYASVSPDMKVVCTKNNSQLTLETKGHIFALDAMGNNEFVNKQFALFFEFRPANKQLLIKEGGTVYYLDRQ